MLASGILHSHVVVRLKREERDVETRKKGKKVGKVPSQRTVTLSKEALIEVSVESIKMEVKVHELVDAIIVSTSWKQFAPNLRSVIMENRKARMEE